MWISFVINLINIVAHVRRFIFVVASKASSKIHYINGDYNPYFIDKRRNDVCISPADSVVNCWSVSLLIPQDSIVNWQSLQDDNHAICTYAVHYWTHASINISQVLGDFSSDFQIDRRALWGGCLFSTGWRWLHWRESWGVVTGQGHPPISMVCHVFWSHSFSRLRLIIFWW